MLLTHETVGAEESGTLRKGRERGGKRGPAHARGKGQGEERGESGLVGNSI